MELAAEAGLRAGTAEHRAERAFIRANEALVVAMAAVMAVLVFVNVVCRYILNFSLVWAEEVSQYLMVWVTFTGAGLALRQGRHVAVEMLQERLPGRARHWVRWAVFALLVAFLAAMTILGVMFAWFARDSETPVLNISMAIPYSAVPVGGLLTVAHLLLVARAYVRGEHEHPPSIEAAIDEGEL